jgi:hypothetical protein
MLRRGILSRYGRSRAAKSQGISAYVACLTQSHVAAFAGELDRSAAVLVVLVIMIVVVIMMMRMLRRAGDRVGDVERCDRWAGGLVGMMVLVMLVAVVMSVF